MRWWYCVLGPVAVSLLLAGCGTGEYKKRLDESVNELRSGSLFADLGPAQPLGDTGMQFRLPKQFLNAADKAGDPLEAHLTAPARLPAQDIKAAFYAVPKDAEGPQPIYQVFFGFRPANPKVDPIDRLLNESVAVLAGDQPLGWQEVSFTTPSGGTLNWLKISGEIRQDFVMAAPDGTLHDPESLPCLVEIYARNDNDTNGCVSMFWRVPNSLKEQIGYEEMVRQVGGAFQSARSAQ